MNGFIYKLEKNGISSDLLNILRDFLSNRRQRVVLNGLVSTWSSVNAEFPQGSILAPFFFLFIYLYIYTFYAFIHLYIYFFLTWLRVGFSHLREHNFRHGFLDIVDPICSCHTNAVENTEHYLLNFSNFTNQRTVLFNDLQNIGINYEPLDSSALSRMLLFGNPTFSDNVNSGLIYAVIKFIESANRFSGSIYD